MQLVSCLCVHCVPLRFCIMPDTSSLAYHFPLLHTGIENENQDSYRLLHTLASNVRFHFTYRHCPLTATFTLLTLVWLKNCFFHYFPPMPPNLRAPEKNTTARDYGTQLEILPCDFSSPALSAAVCRWPAGAGAQPMLSDTTQDQLTSNFSSKPTPCAALCPNDPTLFGTSQ